MEAKTRIQIRPSLVLASVSILIVTNVAYRIGPEPLTGTQAVRERLRSVVLGFVNYPAVFVVVNPYSREL